MSKVFFVCSGLGQIQRGYETFMQECFDALQPEPSLDLCLFKGAGIAPKGTKVLWNLARYSKQASALAKLINRDGYYIEQVTFALSLLPYILYQQPDVIFFSDGTIGNLLWHWRRLTKQKYKLLFSNGGPLAPPFERWDHVQQVAPYHLQTAIDAGEDITKHSCIPYGIKICERVAMCSTLEKQALRSQLELPAAKQLVLSVGALNKHHKRMDYAIREVAALPEPRPFLLLLGQPEAEYDDICELGKHLLGLEHFAVRTVAAIEVAKYYKAADLFVLASLHEGFGRVFLEAMAYGLPCLAHDYEVTRFVLGAEGYYADFRVEGNLSRLLSKVLSEPDGDIKRYMRHHQIYEHFSWEKIRSAYVEMIRSVAETNVSTNKG